MQTTSSRTRRSLAVQLGWGAALLLASAATASAQFAYYGVRSEGGTDWAYIEIPGGEELISAPLVTPTDGFVDLGLELAPVGGTAPVLSLDGPFAAGTLNTFSLSGVQPNTELRLYVGFSSAYVDALGGTLVPTPDLAIVLYSDANGEASYSAVLPANWALDTDVWAQFVAFDSNGPQGVVASNAVRCNGSYVGATFEDPARIEIFGFSEEELEDLEENQGLTESGTEVDIDGLIDLLGGPEACNGADLWKLGFPEFEGTEEELEVLSRLSQHLMFLKEKATAFDGDTWTANGCTSSPDFDFKECCDVHDECYCIGGTQADRKTCDLALRKCIRDKDHPRLACIYYRGVRIFGKKHFNEIP